MNQKTDRKKNLRPKINTQNLDISEPYAFKHDLHIGQEVYQERRVDDLNVFPKSPFLDRKENLREDFSMNSSISQVVQTQVIPAIRSEIGNIVEEKIRYILNEQKMNSDTRHCQACLCPEKKVIVEEEVQIDTNESKNATVIKNPASDAIQEDFDDTLVKSITDSENQNHEEKLKDIKSFTSTPNSKKDISRHFQHGEKLIKYGSDIQLNHDKHTEKEKAQGFMRTRTLPVSAHRTNRNRQHDLISHKGNALSKSDERKCLADALQWHVEELIDGIVFKDSELPDDLLADSCLTDEECAGLRKTLDRKDQVRVLTSIIKGRDLSVLLRFLKHIKSQNEPVARSIEERFEHNKRNGVRCFECAYCNLTSNVNAKYIADRLWKYTLIDASLYNWIVQSDKPTGVQGEMWRGVIDSLNFHCKKHRSDVCRILSSALTKNNHYHHVAQGLERMINIKGEMNCYCKLRPITVYDGSLLSLQSSRSPLSSKSVTDSQSDHVSSQGDIKTVAIQDMNRIRLDQTKTQSDDMKQTGDESKLTILSPEPTVKTCHQQMPVADFHQDKDIVLDDTNYRSKRNVVPEKSTNELEETNASKNKDDNFKPDTYLNGTNDCSKSNIDPKKTISEVEEINLSKKNKENFKPNTVLEDSNDRSKRNTVPEKSTNELEETNASKNKDDNFKPDTYMDGTNDCSKSNIDPKKTISEVEEINLSKKNKENFKPNTLLDGTNDCSNSNIVPEKSTDKLEETDSSMKKIKSLNQQFLKYI